MTTRMRSALTALQICGFCAGSLVLIVTTTALAADLPEGFTETIVAEVGSPSANNYGNISVDPEGNLFVTGGFSSHVYKISSGLSVPVATAEALAVGVLVDSDRLYVGDYGGSSFGFKLRTFDIVSGIQTKPPIDNISANDIVKVPAGWGPYGGQIVIAGYRGTLIGSTVSVIDPETQSVTQIVSSGCCSNLAFTQDGQLLGTTYNGQTLELIGPGGSLTTITTFPARTEAVAVHSLTGDAFVAVRNQSTGEGSLYRVDLDTGNAVVFGSDVRVDREFFPHPLAFSPDGATLYHSDVHNGKYVIVAIDGFRLTIDVSIDIKPGSDRNPINLRSKGNIPVAILSSDTFDATQVNWETVRFGPSGATERHQRVHVKDADYDGYMDVVLHFKTRDTGILCGDKETTLTGETFSGEEFAGSDVIKIIKCPKNKINKKKK